MLRNKIIGIPERENRLRELCAQGFTYDKMRKELRCGENTIIRAIQTLQIKYAFKRGHKVELLVQHEAQLRAMLAERLTFKEIGSRFQCSKNTIARACHTLGIELHSRSSAWEEDREKLLGMLRRGMTRRQMAEELNATIGAVCGACDRLGLIRDDQVQLAQAERRKAARSASTLARRERKRREQHRQLARPAGEKLTKSRPGVKTPAASWRKLLHAVAIPDASTRCSILEIEHGKCHYLGDDGFYCGAPTGDLKDSWCPYHANFVFNRETEMSDHAGGTQQRHVRQGVESEHASARQSVSARPHPSKELEEAA